MANILHKKRRKVQLVLGSGGARGLAHIGVIEALERDGYEIVEVIGCSMGSVVGGLYAAGYLDVFKEWLLTINRSQVFHLLDFSFNTVGFVKGERILTRMRKITGDHKIEDFKIPFTAVATDMVNRKEVYFREGDLYRAMRASMSIPGVFTPVRFDQEVLVDGAVLNPLPLNLVKKRSDAIVIAVSLNGKPTSIVNAAHVIEAADSPEWDHGISESSSESVAITGSENMSLNGGSRHHSDDSLLKGWIHKLLHPASTFKNVQKEVTHKFSLIELMTNSFYFTQDRLVELTILAYPPDLVIDIPRNACNVFDFHKTKEMIELAEKIYQDSREKLMEIS